MRSVFKNSSVCSKLDNKKCGSVPFQPARWCSKIGIKKSSAQITHYYNSENLVGKQVIGVCNFPKKNIAGVVSEVLILGAIEKDGKVVLVHPSQKTENGLDIA